MSSRALAVCLCLLVSLACGDSGSTPAGETEGSEATSSGDGDGDASGDGDGEASGDGDGDASGDGDGEASGDGDGDPSGDGDGDASGDGDGEMGGDGDGEPAEEGFGTIVGACGQLVDEIEAPTPSLFTLHLDFRDDPYDDPEDLPLMTEGAQTILTEPNAGGSSTISEAFAYEVLARCEGALLLQTETEIDYDPEDSKKTDMAVEIAGQRVGVSVTRAVGFPPENPYTPAQAEDLLDGKLADILVSSANVVPEQAWVKQVLVVMAYADMHASSLEMALANIDAMTQADTIVYVVVTDGMDTPVYFN